MEKFISVIIPNYNGGATIGKCLEAAFASDYTSFEVIVADDGSTDNSVEIIKRFPCRLVQLEKHGGASKARNSGARQSRGELLFFTDADCLFAPDSLSLANRAASDKGDRCIIGGTYTPRPYDNDFFSIFQSVFIHYSETKKCDKPDYIASHAMVIHASTFKESCGFPEDFMPILEDVEFSHRLLRKGITLAMDAALQVQHIFRFTMKKSLGNAYRKTKYWICYSLANRDLLADSGTASLELKVSGFAWLASAFVVLCGIISGNMFFLLPLPVLLGVAAFVNRKLFSLFHKTGGCSFAVRAKLYYTLVYPAAVWAGTVAGLVEFLRRRFYARTNSAPTS